MAFVNSPEDKVSFVPEIQLMLYGLGDCSKPIEATAALIETIVLDQLKRLMNQAEDVADKREKEKVGPEDIIFLMRKNESALKRLISYLGVKDEKTALYKAIKGKVDTEEKLFIEDQLIQWNKNRKGYCLEFLETIGIEEDFEMTEDPVKESRQIRANNKTIEMSSVAYQEYHRARCASFSSAEVCTKKFLDWIKQGGIEQEMSIPILEILVYLAKETIANLVDMVLLVREEAPFQMSDSSPITTSEVHEVIRRCIHQQNKPFTGFSKDLPRINDRKIFTLSFF